VNDKLAGTSAPQECHIPNCGCTYHGLATRAQQQLAAESVEAIHYNFLVLTVQGTLDHAAMRVRKLISPDAQAALDAHDSELCANLFDKAYEIAATRDKAALDALVREARREVVEVCASICQEQAESLAKTISTTQGSKGSTDILKQQMASAAGCAWAIKEILPWVEEEKWQEAMRIRRGVQLKAKGELRT
jgi:hypothetical protein